MSREPGHDRLKEFTTKRLLGKGAFGNVYLVSARAAVARDALFCLALVKTATRRPRLPPGCQPHIRALEECHAFAFRDRDNMRQSHAGTYYEERDSKSWLVDVVNFGGWLTPCPRR